MTAKLYINTDITLTINIGTGFTIDDVDSMFLTLTKGTTVAEFAGTVGDGVVTVNIPDTNGITEHGTYTVKITMYDTSGNLLGLTPSVDYLRFWP